MPSFAKLEMQIDMRKPANIINLPDVSLAQMWNSNEPGKNTHGIVLGTTHRNKKG